MQKSLLQIHNPLLALVPLSQTPLLLVRQTRQHNLAHILIHTVQPKREVIHSTPVVDNTVLERQEARFLVDLTAGLGERGVGFEAVFVKTPVVVIRSSIRETSKTDDVATVFDGPDLPAAEDVFVDLVAQFDGETEEGEGGIAGGFHR
jgi:hypothetical protein